MRQHEGRTEFDPQVSARARSARQPFEPWACYSAAADTLYVYTLNVPTFRMPVDSLTTVLISALDQATFAGLAVRGVRDLVHGETLNGVVTVRAVVEKAIAARPSVLWHVDAPALRSVRNHAVSVR